jgi:signal transduction histidine kinase/CheY-like chemotaxis protein
MLQELIRGERPEYHVEKRYIHKSGAAIGVNVNMTVIRDASGHPLRTMATIEDITEKKQLEAQVLRNQRMESIGSLAGGIAHDLNNILAPILMTTSLLRQENTPSERNLIVDTVESAARRGADVINQLLTFARGKPGVLAPIPVRLLLNEMGKLIRETFPRNLQLTIDYPADLWPILGDSTQCHQALMNLCVNARDAMPNGGRLTLAARNVIVDNTVVATALEPRPGPCVCVSVTDSGCGIPPEILSRIFDPFFTTKDIGKGTGLGLPTLLGIMRGHGGFIRVSTMLGCGTTFDLFIPAVPDARAHGPAAPGPPSVQRGHEELILVVDDELVLRKAMELTLKSHGYQVLTAAEGNEALALFATQGASIKAVITDSMMPGMDGPKLVQALRLLAPQLPIIGMSGLAERADDRKSQPFNLPVVLKKPFTSEALCAALHQALSNPSACEACGSTSTSGK